MCGMLQKKIKIKEKIIQRTMKSENIWSFIVTRRKKIKNIIEKSPLRYIIVQWSLMELKGEEMKRQNKGGQRNKRNKKRHLYFKDVTGGF